MRGVEYAELKAFLAVSREGSFRRAAAALFVSPSAISHSVRALEERLGKRLLHRTTRSVSLTEEGARLRDGIAPAFEVIATSVAEAARKPSRPSGLVRLTAPRVAARMILAPALPEFLRRYPGIQVEIDVNDRAIDSVAEGFDAGIRIGEHLRNDMESQPISPMLQGFLVASPDYLARHGTPRSPEELEDHEWLNFRLPLDGRLLPWDFAKGEERKILSKPGPLATNDMDLLVAAAVGGCGIACVTEGLVNHELASGQLMTVLDDWSERFSGWFIYYPKGRFVAPALKHFCEHLRRPAAPR